ncbi:MAG: carbohydrate kinase family protein [Syntrophomonadaceae bacterium]|nr:carbohydrate kinase family protein [Syntrophomonadaceae bacterium]
MDMNISRDSELLIVAPSGYETVIYIENFAGNYLPAKTVRYQGGGHGGNVAYYLSNLGVTCSLYTHWGDDLPGIRARQTMLEAGVDISLCKVFPGETSQSNYLVNIGKMKKTIMNFGSALAIQGTDPDIKTIPKVLYTSLLPVEPALTLVKKVRQMEGEVVLGFQIPTLSANSLGLTHEILEETLPLVNHAIGSHGVVAEEFKSDLKAPELVLWLKNRYPNLKTVVLTDGQNGSYAYVDGEIIHQPAFGVNEVDSTGAGDQFSAVFLRDYILRGIPLTTTMKRAALYSAVVCGKEGSRVLVTDEELDFLRGEELVE